MSSVGIPTGTEMYNPFTLQWELFSGVGMNGNHTICENSQLIILVHVSYFVGIFGQHLQPGLPLNESLDGSYPSNYDRR